MRTTGSGRAGLAAAALIACAALGACSGPSDEHGATTIDMSFAHADSLGDLYRSSDALLDVTLVSGPTYTATDPNAGTYPGASSDTPQTVPLLTKYAVFQARINKVLGNRAGGVAKEAQQTVEVGFNVINPDIDASDVANLEELKSSGFPQVSDLPSAPSRIIVFATPSVLGSLGDGYEAISYATSSATGFVVHFSPGKVKGEIVDGTELTPPAAAAQFSRPQDG